MAPLALPPRSPTVTVAVAEEKGPDSRITLGAPKDGNKEEEDGVAAICYGPVKLSVPHHPSFAAHRAWALTHAAAVFRYWARLGFAEGLSGHISVRDPEFPHLFWMNPLAVHFGLIRASDMLLLSDDPDPKAPERILAGNRRGRPANKAGWAIHSAIHRHHPHVNAACHAHSAAGKTWSATGKRLAMVDQDVCKFYGAAQALYTDYGGVVLGSAAGEGEAIARALGPEGKGAILANHGLLTVGYTVDEAGYLFALMDRSCRVQLDLAKAGIEPVVVGDREAEFNFRMESRADSLYWEFQPEFDYEVAMAKERFDDVFEDELEIRR